VIKQAVIVAARPSAPLMVVVNIIMRGTVREASLT
jgi:hypothetical protein